MHISEKRGKGEMKGGREGAWGMRGGGGGGGGEHSLGHPWCAISYCLDFLIPYSTHSAVHKVPCGVDGYQTN